MSDLENQKPLLLFVAGSDSSGRAGIQVDIKTAIMLGCDSATVLTALTAQNKQAVEDMVTLSADFVTAQFQAVMRDMTFDAIKIGMLVNREVIEAIAPFIEKYDKALVIDPVLVTTSGYRLLEEEAIPILQNVLLPYATLVTPNLPEARRLTGLKIDTLDDMKQATDCLMDKGVEAVLIKGGHGLGRSLTPIVYDLLATQQGFEVFEHQRLETGNFHGTGCKLATAISVGLAKGLNLSQATRQAIDSIQSEIAKG